MGERVSKAPTAFSNDHQVDGHTPAWVVDALFGTAVALSLALIIATSADTARPPNVLAYVFAFGFGALLMLRRSMPRTVLVLSALGMFAYYALDYPAIGVAIPLVAALFSSAEAGLMGWPVGVALIVFVVSMFYRILDGGEALGFILGYETVSNVALFTAAIALGYGVRARRLRALQQAEIVKLTESQLAREAELQVQKERERFSRDLHDIVGHTMSVISLHAGVASEAVGNDDRAASEALDRIRTASNRSLRELRSMVRMLRSPAEGRETHRVQSLSAIQELVDTAKGAGIEIDTAIELDPSDLSDTVDVAAYRMLQESITNIVRHSQATRAKVKANIRDGRLCLTITDNGRGSTMDHQRTGYGIASMTERARLLGGSLTIHASEDAGFTVNAIIPTRLP
ncbi:MAG TPA: sensor histidine kinase [Enteractinococcus helveticum]|uniref:histidine kinase n=1 Tax=Enteractinococcus helveticum TaxID=1837282 RepID=A0A921FJR7_9MICC|nr:sensor histidine kinase [Enteractinococcus helveticum]HJF13333.1 sensor histidine kinase [Enteractinococcus helveticum]